MIDCVLKNNYDESKCAKLIDELYQCCSKFYKENSNEARSPCCPLPDLLDLKMEQRGLKKVNFLPI
ncbi:Cmc4p NDAI_0I00690 [Naumovozyma dairenensis CBS 421]|uniref:Cx9C motif-containing protein 4, mitochondrial n=1 Tax=Naumovozyma dairenensis (strain ATCC 10597 / BCRC 20456 / CBS 421 / NBRC 0211 / NRRL Y-12639) TaxID=1071378 RepID=G0WFS7_NAUDC|nr:hypothetical protein NDAI_0I00690 [Naumovozyma dairenensis CBS 421]CCD26638.1 hypothetical protein NDAI_0I00690 [Naumovozyma dairenensis CBS 421]